MKEEKEEYLKLPITINGATIEAKKPGVRYLTKEEIDELRNTQVAALERMRKENYHDDLPCINSLNDIPLKLAAI